LTSSVSILPLNAPSVSLPFNAFPSSVQHQNSALITNYGRTHDASDVTGSLLGPPLNSSAMVQWRPPHINCWGTANSSRLVAASFSSQRFQCNIQIKRWAFFVQQLSLQQAMSSKSVMPQWSSVHPIKPATTHPMSSTGGSFLSRPSKQTGQESCGSTTLPVSSSSARHPLRAVQISGKALYDALQKASQLCIICDFFRKTSYKHNQIDGCFSRTGLCMHCLHRGHKGTDCRLGKGVMNATGRCFRCGLPKWHRGIKIHNDIFGKGCSNPADEAIPTLAWLYFRTSKESLRTWDSTIPLQSDHAFNTWVWAPCDGRLFNGVRLFVAHMEGHIRKGSNATENTLKLET
jgi:hypothetical protein